MEVRDLQKRLEQELGKNLEKAAIYFQEQLKLTLNTVPEEIERHVGKAGIYYRGIPSSEPGDPPHKVTGNLQRSIAYQMSSDRQSVRVGTSDIVGLFLELGTVKMLPRPWLLPTLFSHAKTLAKIIATGTK
jgi:hypothetical protein